MAVAAQGQGQLQELLGILRRRSWQIILPAAMVLVIGASAAVIVPKKYKVETEIELRNTDDSELGRMAKIASHQIKAYERVTHVIEDLQWPDFLALRESWRFEFVKDVVGNVVVGYTAGNETSSFVQIEYKDVDPKRAIEFLNALRKSWVNEVLERERNLAIAEEQSRLQERSEYQGLKSAEEAALVELRARHGISATQPTPGAGQQRSEDPVYQRMSKGLDELRELDIQASELGVRLQKKRTLYNELPEMVAKDVTTAGRSVERDLEDIDLRIAAKERELASYKPSHSQYAQVRRDLLLLEQSREQIRRRATDSTVSQEQVPNQQKKDVREEIEELELQRETLSAKIETIQIAVDKDTKVSAELQEVYRDVREAQDRIDRQQESLLDIDKSYQAAKRRVERLTSAEGNPFTITQEPRISRKPTEPNPFLIVAFALFAGLGLGLGIALLSEFGKSSFRSVSDVSRALAAPVLGTINRIVTRAEVRAGAARRVIVGVACLSFIGAVVFVTWAWSEQPELLSQGMRDAIEDLRAQLE